MDIVQVRGSVRCQEPLMDSCGRAYMLNDSNFAENFYVTDQPTRYVGLAVYPLLLAISTLGNLFCIVVFMKEKRKRSPIVYLVTLCTANLIVMWFELPAYIGTYYESIREQSSYITFMENSLGYLLWIQQTFVLISNWVLVLFTMDRILSLTHHIFLPRKVHVRQAITACSIIAVLSAVISIPDIVFYIQWLNRTQSSSQGDGTCDITTSMLCDWIEKWQRIQRSMEQFFFDLAVPLLTFLGLLATNMLLMFLHSRERKRKISGNGGATVNREEQRKGRSSKRRLLDPNLSSVSDNRSTPTTTNGTNNSASADENIQFQEVPTVSSTHIKMLTRSVILYFTTQFLEIIFSFVVLLSSYPSCFMDLSRDTIVLWQPIIHMITLLNYSINIFLYLGLITDIRTILRPRVPVRAADYELVPVSTGGKMVRFLERGDGGLAVQLPQMRREKSSVLLPQPVGTVLDGEMFRELWLFLPFRLRIYQPRLIFSTSEDGTSITNFLKTVRGNDATIMAIRTMKGEIFGGYCGTSWDDRVLGKREYLFFGTGETFVFVYNMELQHLQLFPWVGLSGRKTSPDSCLFMAADAHHLTIGGGGEEAISFESSLARGFSGSSLTFNNTPLCEDGAFESAVVEVYGFVDTMRVDEDGCGPVLLDGEQLEEVSTISHLGIKINCHLRWNDQIYTVEKNINFGISKLNRVKLSTRQRVSIYHSLIKPYMDYYCTVWSATSVGLWERIAIAQRKRYESSQTIRSMLPAIHLSS